jgi:hypothetical protein
MENIQDISDFINEGTSRSEKRDDACYLKVNFWGKEESKEKFLSEFKKWNKLKGENYGTWVRYENLGKVVQKLKAAGITDQVFLFP